MTGAVFHRKDMSLRKKMQWGGVLLSALLFCLLPENAVWTHSIKMFLAVTIPGILILCFALTDKIVPAVLIPMMYVVLGVTDFQTAFGAWTSSVIWCSFGFFIMANMMERVGIMKRISYRCIILTGASYKGIIFGLCLTGILINLLTAGNQGFVYALLALCYNLCEALKLGKSRASCGIMLTGVISMLSVGYFIYGPSMMGLMFSAAGEFVSPPGYIEFFLQNACFVPLIFIIGAVIIRIAAPEKPIEGKAFFQEELRAMGKLSKDEKKLMAMMAVLMALIATQSIHKIPLECVFVILPILMFLPGINVGISEDVKRINFPALVFVAGCMSIGSAAKACGVSDLLATALFPFIASMSSGGKITAVFLFGFLINFLLTPLAALSAFSAPICQMACEIGANPLPLLYSFFQGVDNLLLPYERSTFLICYGYGNIEMKDFVSVQAWKSLICLVYLLLVAVPYWKLIGLL